MDITDYNIEQLIVNKFLTDGCYTNIIVEFFDKRIFNEKSVAIILEVSVQFYNKFGKVPTIPILELTLNKYAEKYKLDINTITSFLNDCLKLNYHSDEPFIRENIISFIKSKSYYFTILDNIDTIQTKKDISDCLTKFQKISTITLEDNKGLEYFESIEKHIEDIVNPEARLPFGYKDLDLYTNGGLYRDGRCLMVTMAQPGLGKSMLLSNCAVNYLRQGLFPLIISLEMSEKVYATRIDAHISDIEINSLRYNSDDLLSSIRNFKALHPSSHLIIKEFAPNTINTNTLITYINKHILPKRKPDVIIVDYLNLLQPNNKSKASNSYERVGDVSRELRAMSYLYNIPVISATQTNRGGVKNNDLDMDNISESMGIAHTADFIGALYQQDGDLESGIINYKIVKNRLGGQHGKSFKFSVNYNTLRLNNFNLDNSQISAIEQLQNDLKGELTGLI